MNNPNEVYEIHGCKNRKEYLDMLAEDYGEGVYALAEILGPEEDFDGLVSHLDDL